MSLLPFKTQPQPPQKLIGAADIGELELPVFYGLTISEHQYIEEQTKGLPDTQALLVNLAKKIADELGQTDIAAVASQLQYLSQHPDVEHLVLNKFDKEYKQLKADSEKRSEGDRKAYVSAMILYRLNVADWKPDFINDPEKIRKPLANELYEFAIKEELGWRETKGLDNDMVKKSSTGSTDATPTTDSSTGSVSSTGEEKTPDSAQSTLATSPSG